MDLFKFDILILFSLIIRLFTCRSSAVRDPNPNVVITREKLAGLFSHHVRRFTRAKLELHIRGLPLFSHIPLLLEYEVPFCMFALPS